MEIALTSVSVNKDVTRKDHPVALRPFIPEIDEFVRFNHFEILHPILKSVPSSTFYGRLTQDLDKVASSRFGAA